MTELDCLLILNAVSGFTNARIQRIVGVLGSAEKFFSLSDQNRTEFCLKNNIPREALQKFKHFPKDKFLKCEYNLVHSRGAEIMNFWNDDFPSLLMEIPDCPVLLYVLGYRKALTSPSIAMVGPRRASIYGLMMAEKFAGELAAVGVTIVSGMARGIDTAAHRAALKVMGTTVAVLGCGLSKVFPPENSSLMKEISESGAVLSEFPMQTEAIPFNFPRRNRIVSGLSLGVVVVEASFKSGALITSDCALEQGREVFAIPGKIDQPNAQGANRLIKDGAKMISCTEDILEELKLPLRDYIREETADSKGLASKSSAQSVRPSISKSENLVYEALSSKPRQLDELFQTLHQPIHELSSILMRLELKGLARQLPGKLFVRI